MNVCDSILQVIRRSREPLDEYLGPLHDFLWEQHAADGGFRGPDGNTSLYHTALALETMTALQIEPPRAAVSRYLARFATGHGLSLIELTSLIRAWRALGHDGLGWLPKLERYRSADAGFAHIAGRKQAQVDATFLAACAIPADENYICLRSCRMGRAFVNSPDEPWIDTISTALSLLLLKEYPDDVIAWLLERQAPKGGFFATLSAQVPDLLSTAITLHTLRAAGKFGDGQRDTTMDFLDSLWQNRGGFQESWSNPEVSIETIYYGLLALGHVG